MEGLGKMLSTGMERVKEASTSVLLKETPLDKNLKEACANTNWGASNSLLADIAAASFDFTNYPIIMRYVWDALGDKPSRWRRILKTLSLVEFLVTNGTERAVDEVREGLFRIRVLMDFRVSEDGRDKGSGIRDKAKHVVELVNELDMLKAERQRALKNRQRIVGISGRGERTAMTPAYAQEDPYTSQFQLSSDIGVSSNSNMGAVSSGTKYDPYLGPKYSSRDTSDRTLRAEYEKEKSTDNTRAENARVRARLERERRKNRGAGAGEGGTGTHRSRRSPNASDSHDGVERSSNESSWTGDSSSNSSSDSDDSNVGDRQAGGTGMVRHGGTGGTANNSRKGAQHSKGFSSASSSQHPTSPSRSTQSNRGVNLLDLETSPRAGGAGRAGMAGGGQAKGGRGGGAEFATEAQWDGFGGNQPSNEFGSFVSAQQSHGDGVWGSGTGTVGGQVNGFGGVNNDEGFGNFQSASPSGSSSVRSKGGMKSPSNSSLLESSSLFQQSPSQRVPVQSHQSGGVSPKMSNNPFALPNARSPHHHPPAGGRQQGTQEENFFSDLSNSLFDLSLTESSTKGVGGSGPQRPQQPMGSAGIMGGGGMQSGLLAHFPNNQQGGGNPNPFYTGTPNTMVGGTGMQQQYPRGPQQQQWIGQQGGHQWGTQGQWAQPGKWGQQGGQGGRW
eukprot:GHVN01012252.1.p1 GENE.GHVN01012252.1~~GHVN01012252.1.p1  ORF type:complete len:701 (-),score=191.53 GHVN01012252.1:305-2320(-)